MVACGDFCVCGRLSCILVLCEFQVKFGQPTVQ